MGTILQRLLRAMGLKRFKRRYQVDMRMAERLENLALKQERDPEQVAVDLLAEGIARRVQAEQKFELWDNLSPRERQVVALVCLGYTNREIGEKLYISYDTVKSHVSHAMSKFNVKRRGKIQRLLSDWDFSEWDC